LCPPEGKAGAHEGANITKEEIMKRPVSLFVLVGLAFVAAFVLAGCGRESSSAEREERRGPSAERSNKQASSPDPEPKHVGEIAEVGPLLVTLNDVKPYSSGDQGGGVSQSHYYVVVDLTLENGAQTSFDASEVDYLLRDEEGYSFGRKSVPDQKPPPEGQITPGGKAICPLAFDLGKEPVGVPLTLFVSLPEQPDAPQGFLSLRSSTRRSRNPHPTPRLRRKALPGRTTT